MTAEALLALADRCEREEPSRELDAEIAKSIGYQNVEKANDWGRTDFVGDAPNGDSFACWLPSWTTSLDAAVGLVPEGWVLLSLSEIGLSGMNHAHLGQTVNPCANAAGEGTKTLALALCAAALRARAALLEKTP